MPLDFPDFETLKRVAEMHKFRQPFEGESEEYFRRALADHVQQIDLIESCEIRNKIGWDKWNEAQKLDCLMRGMAKR